ncbi:MAG TPA: endonuclease/exonuclease/phosphatase family protein [Bacteroidales bacterium]|nr:endonuclease/exonuclease/phosphatase family protein [Bacteroidales bacterium]
MKRLFFFITAAVILIFLKGCSDKSDEYAIKVITFNIRYDNPRDSVNAWPNRAPMVRRFIEEEKPDIIGMQEVLLHQYNLLDSVLNDYSSVGVGRSDGVKAGEMNPVFYRKDRFDIIRTKTFWLSETPEIAGSQAWGANLPRIVTWMELSDKNTQEHIFLFNTHFAHDSDSARIMSSELLLNKVDSIASGFPFVITGDFNMLHSSTGYDILTGPRESVPLLIDTYAVSEKRHTGPAYTFNGFSEKASAGRIDYIFVRNGMRVLEHRTFIKKEHGIYISDHWPVMAVVSTR